MSWLLLGIAGCMELVFVIFLEKATQGKKQWLVVSLIAILLSIYLLGQATQFVSLGVAYAVWTGIGSVLTVGYGILCLGENRSKAKLFFVLLIVIGIIGLKLS
ncbi:QacE family quaternary ammonium compound efflux SMR transporter [Enterococcus saccharolyticus]|uniref:Multidrug resistance protein, SMR family n=1 Tax=Candidatus Enterococcus willemsii TaxID=1857215 RepID=A0ABQ6YZV2_9ENTE|nr:MULTISPECIES: SMR family transporter [Enterococcus]KAF1304142.1 multidrug resistance protein, SMR family [Enterococcus sp. CU12B]MCD5001984.1 QacE family quaternary ammonium compound efflux SMR transporter [Enterococcus saccharolyticus]